MMSLESVFPEEWRLSNVLSSTDLYWDELHRNHITHDGGGGGGSELWKADLCNQLDEPNDSGIGLDLDSFSIPWLDEESTCITNLDASLQISSLPDVDDPVAEVLADLESMESNVVETGVGSFETPVQFLVPDKITTPVGSFEEKSNFLSSSSPAPSSPIELSSLDHVRSVVRSTPVVKYVEPSSIDTTGLTSGAQIVMNDLNVLHLPELQDDQAGLMLIEALTDPALAVELPLEEVESMLSSPPSSPEATVPTSSYQDADDDDEYVPTSRKRKATSGVSGRSLKSLKPSEKKERKKVQNKNAATKYRIKKRQEDDQVKVELEQLESRNVNLRRQVEDLTSEITYMKGLLNEVLKGKGLKIK